MSNRKIAASVVSALLLASMVLAACGQPQQVVVTSPPQQVVVTAPGTNATVIVTAPPVVQTSVVQVTAPPEKAAGKVLHVSTGAGDIPTIDPALSTDSNSIQMVDELTVGLTRLKDEDASTQPGMASKWEASSDGKTLTFHLMPNVPWVRFNPASGKVEKVQDDNGKDRVVTAFDFAWGITRTLDPKTASDYAYVLLPVIDGASDFNGGTAKDSSKVGVTAVDTYTLQIKLVDAYSFAPAVLGLWVAHAQPQWIIADKGDRWTETGFQQSYGPYTLMSWNHDSDMTIIKNPFWPGTDSVPQAKIDEVNAVFLDETPTFNNYQSGQLDVTIVPLPEADRVNADPELSKELHVSPIGCTYYYGFNMKRPPFDNQKIRLAFSEAIDRQSLIDNVTKGGQEPAQWFARPGSAAAPTIKDHPDLGVKYNLDDAKKLFSSVYPDPSKFPQTSLVVNQVEGHVKIAEAIANMWKTAFGVTVQIQQQEWKVFLKTVRSTDPNTLPQVWRLGWCYDYPDADSWDREVFHSDNGKGNVNGNPLYINPDVDKLTDQAAKETDTAKRVDLYAQVENIIVKQDVAIAPIYWYTSLSLTKPYVQRTHSVNSNSHWEFWDIMPH